MAMAWLLFMIFFMFWDKQNSRLKAPNTFDQARSFKTKNPPLLLNPKTIVLILVSFRTL